MSDPRVLVVRHGESTWNAVRRWQGQADPPLSRRGETQAERAVEAALELGGFDAVASSDLRRARSTGSIIATRLGLDLLPAESGLSERSAGEWEGLTRGEIEARYPGYLADGRRPSGYESDESIVDRSSRALRLLVDRHPGRTLLVVSHGGIIHALERAHSDSDDGWQRLDNLAGRWFAVDRDSIVPDGPRVALVPDGGPAIPPPDRHYT
ncbi:histidine phosphatase family protein [Ilumatobacter nonamiensis]|uniref:histidine phosphatase family protein n=1 Tax=Ilumatobacter nonamiensis TaxID=467093 RepID=UPI000687B343|nr:histidine phosphatase family protein [Ilumatobacter nonamiensis]